MSQWIRPLQLLLKLSVYFLVTGSPVWAQSGDQCERRLLPGRETPAARVAAPRGEFEKLGGLIIRLRKVHGDGYGDMMNALALADEIKQKWPNTPISIFLDQNFAYESFANRFPEFEPQSPVNFLHGVEVLKTSSKRAREVMAQRRIQILRIPSASSRFTYLKGEAKYNIYLEEPGASADGFQYMDLQRGQITADTNGKLHLQISPGFGAYRSGVNLPTIQLPERTRTDLLRELTERTGFALPQLEEAQWGFAYHHRAVGRLGNDYYEGLLKGLNARLDRPKPVFIFDFSLPRQTSNLSWFLGALGLSQDGISPRFNHWYADGTSERGYVGLGRVSPFTIVHVEGAPHELFLQFMKHADLPVLVTGTQSLFEALAMEVPFFYDLLDWKYDMAAGMADHAIKHFDEASAKYLIALLMGDACRDYATLKRAYDQDTTYEWDIKEGTRKKALAELVSNPQRRVLLQKFIVSLKQESDLVENLDRAVLALENYSARDARSATPPAGAPSLPPRPARRDSLDASSTRPRSGTDDSPTWIP